MLGGCGDNGGTKSIRPATAGETFGSASTSPDVASPSASGAAPPSPSAAPGGESAQLPRGGRTIFPQFRVVAYYGASATGSLGVLGRGTPDESAAKLATAAKPFEAGGRPILPAFELIATVAQGKPGDGGNYSELTPDDEVQTYLDAARRAKVLLVLDIQPGRARFLDQVKHYEKFLLEPDVGLALDPEWVLKPGQLPLKQIGSTDAATINEVSAYLSDLVASHNLPEKLFVIHQFRVTMVTSRDQVVARPGLATTFHIDGNGGQQIKLDAYAILKTAPPFHNGFKLFYEKDTNLMTPAQVLALQPQPELITYQ